MNNFIQLKGKKIIITGGPSTGKTAVIEQLEKDGFHCLHEVIRNMTSEEINQGEKIKIVSNPIISVSDPMKFNLRILNARIEQYKTAQETNGNLFFFDRGIPDVLAYMDCFQQNYDSIFINACDNLRYDNVFLMPPWKEIHISDNERYESFEESLSIYECLKNSYERHSYDVTIVPIGSIAERVAFILEQINAT
ncbi:MAG: ATP-binding protein [Maribacter sp.]|nr:ATP-binding protein [Maribacter sp.]